MTLTETFHRLAAEEARHHDPLKIALRSLRSTACVLQTGAHPDDETSGLLALLARRHGVHLAYACATRGEGGQNVLGLERGDDLAMIRVREMQLAAQSLGCSLHWLSEGIGDPIRDWRFSKSGEETLEKWGYQRTLERMVRIIREVQPDILCPTFLDVGGQHGHHRAMTRIVRKAYEIAADARAFPQHTEAGLLPWAVSKLYLPAWSGAGGAYDDEAPPPTATVHHDIGDIDLTTGVPYARIGEWSRRFHATQGMGEWIEAGAIARPLYLAASRVGPTGVTETSVLDGLPATLMEWALAESRFAADLKAADLDVERLMTTPINFDVLDENELVAFKRLEQRVIDEPAPPRLATHVARTARAILEAWWCATATSGGPVHDTRVGHPSLELEPVPHGLVVNRSQSKRIFSIAMAARANADIEEAQLAFGVTKGVTGAPIPPLSLRATATERITSTITIDPNAAASRVQLPLIVSNRRALALKRAEYPHTGVVSRLWDPTIDIQIIDARIAPGTRVGYAGGGFDKIDHWLDQMGVPVEPLDLTQETWPNSTIVIGIQAFGAREDLVAAIPRLHAFVRNGGHLVTFYHRPQDRFSGVPLAQLVIGTPSVRWRVTLEDAPVTHLAPEHVLLTGPNKIDNGDWAHWTKERGLYFASDWDAAYTPLIGLSDPGEASLHGALLSGAFGKGRHTYCALALHTELDALVPGAFRLLANLVQPA